MLVMSDWDSFTYACGVTSMISSRSSRGSNFKIIEQSIEFQRPLLINYIDFKKAFDSVHRESLWNIVRTYGIPQHYINIFRNLYLNSSCCVRTDNGMTDFFSIDSRVHQGCILCPFLFLLVVYFIMRKAMSDAHLGISWKDQRRLMDLHFADDIVLLAETSECLQGMTTNLEAEGGKIGLRINSDKTKLMQVGNTQTNTPLVVGRQPIEEVQRFTYLGSTLTTEVSRQMLTAESVTRQQCSKDCAQFGLHQQSTLQKKFDCITPSSCQSPFTLAEMWKITSRVARKLNVFHQRCLRKILGVTYCDRVTSEEILQRCGSRALQDIVTERRGRFAGHILCLPDQLHPKTAMRWILAEGRRKRGRPLKTWRTTFKDDLLNIGIS